MNAKSSFRTAHGCWLLSLALLAVGCRSEHLPDKAVFGGGRAVSGGLTISGPNLVIEEGLPGVVFGTHRVPNSPEAMSYVVVFKHAGVSIARSGFAPRSNARADAQVLSANLNLDLEEARLEIAHRIALSPTRTQITNETLSILDQVLDLSAGRFFYVDLTAQPTRIEQSRVPLPALNSDLKDSKEVERVAWDVLKALQASSPEVKRLVRR